MATTSSDNGTSTPHAQPVGTASDHGLEDRTRPTTAPSDYGSDIDIHDRDDDSILAAALETKPVLLPAIALEPGAQHEDRFAQAGYRAQIPPTSDGQTVDRQQREWQQWPGGTISSEKIASKTDSSQSQASTPLPSSQASPPAKAGQEDGSPLARFRTKPKKPLSVTDLVSPAWCELQYLYTLSRFGRKPATKAMRAGSRIHEMLHDQVHSTVSVEVESKEDRFGLRLWNHIAGLRCLSETGLTRELEVWGIIKGQVVNGVIDELSYHSPDSTSEEQSSASNTQAEDNIGLVASMGPVRRVYITDVKTRSVPSVPSEASLRPTSMQLMLYHKLLQSLARNLVDAELIFARYDLRPREPFTDAFIQGIDATGPDRDAINFPNLLSLWSLMITQLQSILPPGSLSPLLRAEFRYAKTNAIIGSKIIHSKDDAIDEYIIEQMAFWSGSREAQGVEIEEAFKCRICDFAEHCDWRKTKADEAIERNRRPR